MSNLRVFFINDNFGLLGSLSQNVCHPGTILDQRKDYKLSSARKKKKIRVCVRADILFYRLSFIRV